MSEPAGQSRLLIVDDHPLFREGLRQLIERDPDLVVCGEVAEVAEALGAIPELKPDLVLVDISLGGASGIDLIKAIKNEYDELPVLVISMHDESLYAERSLRAGAMGYVMKHEPGKTVKNAIRKVLRGEIYLSDKMSWQGMNRQRKPRRRIEPKRRTVVSRKKCWARQSAWRLCRRCSREDLCLARNTGAGSQVVVPRRAGARLRSLP